MTDPYLLQSVYFLCFSILSNTFLVITTSPRMTKLNMMQKSILCIFSAMYKMGLIKNNMKTKTKEDEGKILSNLESPEERKQRILSLYITHFSMFLSGFGNAIIYIGMFPYIQAVSLYTIYVHFRLNNCELNYKTDIFYLLFILSWSRRFPCSSME